MHARSQGTRPGPWGGLPVFRGTEPAQAAWARCARLALPGLLAAVLAACGSLPQEGVEEQPTEEPMSLRPLVRQVNTPAHAPRSHVPLVRYELTEGRTEEETEEDEEKGQPEPPAGEVYQRGGASWYGLQFHQRLTASGERFDMGAMTAAHKTLPFHTRVCVRSQLNGREVLVRINDRGPFVPTRVIDLSRAAADAIGMIDVGIKQVTLRLIEPEGGRCAGKEVGEADKLPASRRRR